MSQTAKKPAPDRSKIAINDDQELKYWTRHLKISRAELQRAVEKVGDSAGAIRKELARI